MPWLTPDEIPEADTCRPLSIPDSAEWLGLVSGALVELTKSYNWEQFGTVTPDEAAQRMLEMMNSYYADNCGAGASRYRINPLTLLLEVSTDDGATWVDSDVIPPTPERTGTGDKVCLAAANAAHVIALLYEQVIDAYNTDTAFDFVLAALSSGIGLSIASLFGAPVAAIIAAGAAVFALAYEALDILFTDYFTPAIESTLKCILENRATLDGNVVTFDGPAIMQDLRDMFWGNILTSPSNLVWEQIVYLLSILGEEGLNHAGATTEITTADCTACGVWSHTVDLTNWKTPDSRWWTIEAGSPSAVGLQVVQQNPSYYAGNGKWCRVRLKTTLPDGVTMTLCQFGYQGTGDGWHRAAGYFTTDPPLGLDCTSFCSNPFGSQSLSLSGYVELVLWIYLAGAPAGNPYMTHINMAGTGRNPFTGV